SREAWNIAKAFGPTNSSRVPAHTRQQLKLATSRVARVATSSFHDKNSRSRSAIASAVQKVTQYLESLEPEELLFRCQQLESITRTGDKVFGWSNQDPAGERRDLMADLFRLSPEELSDYARREEQRLSFAQAKAARGRVIDVDPCNQSDSEPETDLRI